MDTLGFLRAVWPATGLYCLAVPSATGYHHEVFKSLEAAIGYAAKAKDIHNVFFNVHTLNREKIWNSTKKQWSVRLQTNTRAAKTFFFDLDVGEEGTLNFPRYATRRDAVAALIRFVKTVNLPIPFVVSSGGGLHVYWPVEDEIPSAAWRVAAEQLHALAQHHGLLVDPSRTTDSSSLLRVVGTYNHKTGTPRPVQVLREGQIIPNDFFLDRLATAAKDLGVISAEISPRSTGLPADSNLGSKEFDGPPATIQSLGRVCAQVRAYAKSRGNVPYTPWHKMINLIRFVEDGRQWAHALSTGHKEYSPAETDAKLDDQERNDIRPTTCAVIGQHFGGTRCQTCPIRGKVRSPMSAARWPVPEAAPPLQPGDGDHAPVERLPIPTGFVRVSGGKIVYEHKTDKGLVVQIETIPNDLFPILRQVDSHAKTDQHLWQVALPNETSQTFVMHSGLIHEPTKLAAELSRYGIYIQPANIRWAQKYMSAYIQDLQRAAAAEVQHNHLGWTNDYKSFVLHDKALHADGTETRTTLGQDADTCAHEIHHIGKQGEMLKQIKLLQFYDQPKYLPHQFYLLGGLAAPLFHMTGHAGVILHAEGQTGASKSSALAAAGSFWGLPSSYALNGNTSGATVNARFKSMEILANLPLGIDEITNIRDDVAKDFALNVSQPNTKVRLKRDSSFQPVTGGKRSTIIMTTGNCSLHHILSLNNPAGSAGSMRVFEIHFPPADPREKAAATSFLFGLEENYGHIGEVYMRYVVSHYEEIKARVRVMMAAIDAHAGIAPSERFWSAEVACHLVALEITNKLGLLSYDVRQLRNWVVTAQLPRMRDVVHEEYPSPIAVMTSYIEDIAGETLVVTGKPNNLIVTKEPHGRLSARYETEIKMLWILKDSFKLHCTRRGIPHTQYLEELCAKRIILNMASRKILGQGSVDLEKGRSYCLQINMDHPDIADHAADLLKQRNSKPKLTLIKLAPRLTSEII